METSLHRQLKEMYAGSDAQLEVPVAGYRIDAVAGESLVEIQHGSLAAIRDKTRALLDEHRVLIVKPIVAGKQLVRLAHKGGRVLSRRRSPKRGSIVDLFQELVYFTRVFPHPNLTLEVPLVQIEEWRYPGHGRRRRRREKDFVVQDQRLLAVDCAHRFQTADQLAQLVPDGLPTPFHTGDLAEAFGIDRWIAQKMAYCFRETGAAVTVGKSGNALLYEFKRRESAAA